MINSVYEKRKENLRKGINVLLTNNAEDFLKYTSKRTYINHKIFLKDYAAIHEIKWVLDLSKWKMYDSPYNFVKKNFYAEFLISDTASLTYEIKSENVYEEFFWWKALFDFSNF